MIRVYVTLALLRAWQASAFGTHSGCPKQSLMVSRGASDSSRGRTGSESTANISTVQQRGKEARVENHSGRKMERNRCGRVRMNGEMMGLLLCRAHGGASFSGRWKAVIIGRSEGRGGSSWG